MSSNAFFHRPPFRQPRDKKSRNTSRRRSAACMDIASDGSRHFGVRFVQLTCNERASSICQDRPVPARVWLPVSVGFSAECERDVRFGSKADICSAKRYVRFTPESGHLQRTSRCPLSANSGHSQCKNRCPLCANSGHAYFYATVMPLWSIPHR